MNGIVYVVAILLIAVTAYPLYFIIIASISDPELVAYGKVFLVPQKISLAAYQEVFKRSDIWVSYRNTIFYATAGTLWNMALTIPAAYALSKKRLHGRSFFLFFITFTMYFSGGMIPSYINIKNLHLLNTWAVLIVSSGVSAYNLIIAKTFFSSSVPAELEEAATIDGCGIFKTFLVIVLPISKAMLAVIMLYYLVGHWNSYTNALIYLSGAQEKWPLALVLRNILVRSQVELSEEQDAMEVARYAQLVNLLKYALIVVSSLPLMIFYPIIQKSFEKGILLGSIKG